MFRIVFSHPSLFSEVPCRSLLPILFLAGSLFADGSPDSSKTAITLNSREAALVQELSERDAIMAVRDSVASVKEAVLRAELQKEQNQCKNWEQSWKTLKDEHEKCSRALRISIDAQMDASAQKKDEASSMTVSSFLAGIVIGLLAGWYFL
jgi:F0F1-type ATP synthase assembly protein I